MNHVVKYIETIFVIFCLLVVPCYAKKSSDDYYYKGVEYAVEGKFEKALKIEPKQIYIKASLKTVDDVIKGKIKTDAASHFFRAVIFRYKDMTEKQIEELSKAIELEPNFSAAYFERGACYHQKRKKYTLAICDYTKSIELKSEYLPAMNFFYRGHVFSEMGQYD